MLLLRAFLHHWIRDRLSMMSRHPSPRSSCADTTNTDPSSYTDKRPRRRMLRKRRLNRRRLNIIPHSIIRIQWYSHPISATPIPYTLLLLQPLLMLGDQIRIPHWNTIPMIVMIHRSSTTTARPTRSRCRMMLLFRTFIPPRRRRGGVSHGIGECTAFASFHFGWVYFGEGGHGGWY